MVKQNAIIIEGTNDVRNGDLRQGFHKLLSQDLEGMMPRIIMGAGKSQAADKFRNSSDTVLLCDLDSINKDDIDDDLKKYDLTAKKERVFYMIPEMESWFISQSKILDEFYSDKISTKLARKHASQFSNPDEELQRITKNTKKGGYHKIRHGVELLKMLDSKALQNDFPEYKRLIEYFKNKK